MARETFAYEIQRLEADLLALGHLVQHSLLEATQALKRQDLITARRIIATDSDVNDRQYTLEADCLALIAMQQPMAGDLRVLSSIIAIGSELERMHDYAKGIGKIALMLGSEPQLKSIIDLPRMALCTQGMLHRAMLAFSRRDLVMARAIPEEDDEVDALYNQIYRELITYILADPQCIEQANYLLWAAHNLERAADRVTNICERTIFTITAERVELDAADNLFIAA